MLLWLSRTHVLTGIGCLFHKKGRLLYCFVFRDRVSVCSPSCPGARFVDQAGLEPGDPIKVLPHLAKKTDFVGLLWELVNLWNILLHAFLIV